MTTLTTLQVEKVARNINAMDLFYCYSDDYRVWTFWSNLENKLWKILDKLNDADKSAIKALCEEDKAKHFGL